MNRDDLKTVLAETRNTDDSEPPIGDPADRARRELALSDVEPGQVWRHYKGGDYEIVAKAIDEVTLTPVVVYRSRADGTVWVRPLAQWIERIDIPGEMLTQPRFRRTRKSD